MRVKYLLKDVFFLSLEIFFLKGPSHNANDAMVDLVINENKIKTHFKIYKYTG